VIVGRPAYANVTTLVLPNGVAMIDCGIELPSVEEARREIEEVSSRKVDACMQVKVDLRQS
jgi:hypothetical protein